MTKCYQVVGISENIVSYQLEREIMKEMPTVGKLQCSQCFAVEWFGQLPGKHYVELGLATAIEGSFYVMGIGNCSLEITVLTSLEDL